jgi:glutamyl-tRNA reductase
MQRLLLLGLNHKTASLELRERLAFSPQQRSDALAAIRRQFQEVETVLLSTCNRTEIYLARPTHGHPRHSELADFLAEFRGISRTEINGAFYEKAERDVISHLFTVAGSLDSMVLGETQILGQVREAYEAAKEAGAAGPMLHPLFQRAIAVGKQIRSETALSKGRISVASIAVQYARRIFDVFTDKTVLNIGAGKMGELVLAAMAALKPGNLIVCNRDFSRAEALAKKYSAVAVAMDRLTDQLAAADIVITGTGSDQPIITRPMFESVIRRRRYRPVFIIDIGVPRDVAADVGDIENVYLYNLDDLQRAIDASQESRSAAAQQAAQIVERQVGEFVAWHRARMVGPLIDLLYQRSHSVALEELNKTVSKLSGVTPADKQQLEELTRRIVNKLLHDPIQVLRGSDALHAPMAQYLHAVEKLFNLEENEAADEPPNPEGKA